MKKLLILALALITALCAVTACSDGASSNDNYTILEEGFGNENYAVGMRAGDNAFTLRFQEIMDEMIADGKAAEISNKWFDSDKLLKDVSFPREITAVEGDTSLQYILDKGTLVLGLDENFPPMGYRDDSGEIVGFDIDLARELCTRLGVELIIQPIDWSAKELELSGKSIDVIWNGMSVTDERIESMNLSKPYISNSQIIITAKDSGITTKADLAGKKIAIQAGSSALDAVNAEPDVVASFGELVEYADNNTAFLDLKSSRVDAFVVDETYGRFLLASE